MQPDKYAIRSVGQARDADPADFTTCTLIEMGANNSELARQLLAEAKRLGTADNLSREEVARQMGAWVYRALEAAATIDLLEQQFAASSSQADVPQLMTEVIFREPPAA